LILAAAVPDSTAAAEDADLIARGAHLFRAANCQSCHTEI
jgi:mono/diheme cytochrome c family protein